MIQILCDKCKTPLTTENVYRMKVSLVNRGDIELPQLPERFDAERRLVFNVELCDRCVTELQAWLPKW